MHRECRAGIAGVMAAALVCNGCAMIVPRPRVVVAGAHPAKRLRVAVLPFDNRTTSEEDVGEIAARYFEREFLRLPQYEVVSVAAAEKTLRVETEVESSSRKGSDKERVQYIATEQKVDPVLWGRAKRVDAVLTGSVTRFRHRTLFILPPASVGIEVQLVDVRTRKVLWSASDNRGYGGWRWLASIIWPVGVLLALTSPSADERLSQSCGKTADAIRDSLPADVGAGPGTPSRRSR